MDETKKAIEALRGVSDEANTIALYLERLMGDDYDVEETYIEIIRDEFNHIMKFANLAADLLDITISED